MEWLGLIHTEAPAGAMRSSEVDSRLITWGIGGRKSDLCAFSKYIPEPDAGGGGIRASCARLIHTPFLAKLLDQPERSGIWGAALSQEAEVRSH